MAQTVRTEGEDGERLRKLIRFVRFAPNEEPWQGLMCIVLK
jgi:hypothetical protein